MDPVPPSARRDALCVRADGDLYVPAADLWLDPRRTRPRAFVSHAHGDHVGRHARTFASHETAALMRVRQPDHVVTDALAFGEERVLGAARVRLVPAGHILGAAQLVVEAGGRRLVFTGDLRLRASRTAAACEPVPCDELVLESTFGDPRFRFPDEDALDAAVRAAIAEARAAGRVPVLLAYALGKAQEVMAALRDESFLVDRRTDAFCRVYEARGLRLPPREVLRAGMPLGGRVVVWPPHRLRSALLRPLGRLHRVALTGWAADPAHVLDYPCEGAVAWSDHAGWEELLAYVAAAAPAHVHLVHGHAPALARVLAEHGHVVTSD